MPALVCRLAGHRGSSRALACAGSSQDMPSVRTTKARPHFFWGREQALITSYNPLLTLALHILIF